MSVNPQVIVLAVLWLVSVLTVSGIQYAFTRVGRNRDNKSAAVLQAERDALAELKIRDKEFTELKREVAVMKAEAVPQTAAFLASLVANIKHFHTPDLDKAVAEIKPDVALTPEETANIKTAMAAENAQDDPLIDREEHLRRKILLDVHELAVIESQKRSSGEVSKLETLLISRPAQTDGEETEKKDKEENERKG